MTLLCKWHVQEHLFYITNLMAQYLIHMDQLAIPLAVSLFCPCIFSSSSPSFITCLLFNLHQLLSFLNTFICFSHFFIYSYFTLIFLVSWWLLEKEKQRRGTHLISQVTIPPYLTRAVTIWRLIDLYIYLVHVTFGHLLLLIWVCLHI